MQKTSITLGKILLKNFQCLELLPVFEQKFVNNKYIN